MIRKSGHLIVDNGNNDKCVIHYNNEYAIT